VLVAWAFSFAFGAGSVAGRVAGRVAGAIRVRLRGCEADEPASVRRAVTVGVVGVVGALRTSRAVRSDVEADAEGCPAGLDWAGWRAELTATGTRPDMWSFDVRGAGAG
jgi:hypothetical protein